MEGRPGCHRVAGIAAAVTECLAATGCLGIGSSAPALPRHQVFGAGTGTVLVLDAAASSSAVKVSRSKARHVVEHPFAAPELAGPLKQFGLAQVTANDLSWQGPDPKPTYSHRLAWIGIYEISKNAEHPCPASGGAVPTNLPPVFDHYYFAVIVDPVTGQQATWNQDMSGLLIRDCTGIPTHSRSRAERDGLGDIEPKRLRSGLFDRSHRRGDGRPDRHHREVGVHVVV